MGSDSIRIYTLARELQRSSKEVLALSHTLQIEATTPSSSISQADADRIMAAIQANGVDPAPPPKPPSSPLRQRLIFATQPITSIVRSAG
ncbi:translation initiation factor IF-2 N-terminal domain-containing protein [Acaryochloris sp. 'Moss Beach']|uniref:translation initiation factor IF-2 N-terminal domain-containing protein n=1 Tax=Acaryochloris sp. 'Moss Beach' TaxID=2740837 RepID=UPI001F294C6F|nr:translation initiation factor IF-2 N-terminal domain-containing protein [Acaryochloris sp. 'Moss Beach']UJB68263.1 translation initiation factor IF-2 N-terminal domain-containing protein [Acaryochloris sp. 'Moss Beach']